MRFGAFLLALCCVADPVAADPAQTARDIARQLSDARSELAQARGERDQLRAFAGAVGAYDRALAASWAGVQALAEAEAQAALRSAEARARLDAISLGLLRLETVPEALKGQHPAGPLAAAQAQAILRAAQPAMRAGLDAEISALNEITTLRALHAASRDDMAAALVEVKDARAAMLAVADERRDPGRAALAAQVAQMAAASGSLQALAETLDTVGVAALDEVPQDRPLWALVAPVDGAVVAGFDTPDAAGVARPGLVVEAPARSLIVAPADGSVAYAGPFLSAGDVVVLRITNTTLLALNGLGGLAVATGDQVSTGDPLGFLGSSDTGADEYLITKSTADSAFPNEPLYIELRLDGIATDPAPYFDFGRGQER